jgi:hypothetical protein
MKEPGKTPTPPVELEVTTNFGIWSAKKGTGFSECIRSVVSILPSFRKVFVPEIGDYGVIVVWAGFL